MDKEQAKTTTPSQKKSQKVNKNAGVLTAVTTNPNGAGRPTVMTTEVIGKLEQVFSLDGSIKEACFFAGINPDTYYTWIKDKPEYSERFEALREKPILLARQTIVGNLKNPAGAQWYLEKKRKAEFGTALPPGDDAPKQNIYNFFFSQELQNEVKSMEEKIKEALIQKHV